MKPGPWETPCCDGSGETKYGWCPGCVRCLALDKPSRPSVPLAAVVGPAAPLPHNPYNDPWLQWPARRTA